MYKIWCEVSEGVTGYRAAFLRRAGEILTFSDRDEAQQEADRLNDKANKKVYSSANYKYSVTRE